MRYQMRILIYVLLIALIQSCDMNKLPPKEFNYEHTRVYEKSYNQTWDLLKSWCKINQAYIYFDDQTEGLMNICLKIPDSLIYKYTDYSKNNSNSSFYDVNCNIYIFLKIHDNKTQVDIKTNFIGKENNTKTVLKGQYTEIDSVKHQSTGILEKEIFEYLSRHKG